MRRWLFSRVRLAALWNKLAAWFRSLFEPRPVTTAELKRQRQFRPRLEQLEPRYMMAGDVGISVGWGMEMPAGLLGPAQVSFMVSRSDMMGTASVQFQASNGAGPSGAQAGFDYQATSGTLNFAMGEMSKIIQVPILDDNVYEGPETLNVALSNPVNMTLRLGQESAVGTIQDNEQPPTVGFDPASTMLQVGEAVGSAIFTVRLTGSTSTQPVTVNYATMDGMAVAPGDYAATSGQLTFAPGETQKTIPVPIVNDNIYEASLEGFGLTLTNIIGATPGTTAATATIQDNDPLPGVSVNDVTVDEPAGTSDVLAQFNVTLTGASSQPISVNYYTTDGTARVVDGDYNFATGMLTFLPGETSKLVNVAVHNDALDEIDETFQLNLTTAPGATIARGQGIGTILDNDGPSINVSDVTVNEADGTATFVVTLSAASPQTITVAYATADNTALAGEDYTAKSDTLTFAPGEPSKPITIDIANDHRDEPDETFVVNLTGATNATILDDHGVGAITDNDPPPEIDVLVDAGANPSVSVADNDGVVDFGTTTVGTPITKTFTIQNEADSLLQLGTPTLPDGFSLVGTFPSEVGPQDSATFEVQFGAEEDGFHSGKISFVSNDPDETPYDFFLDASASQPLAEISVLDANNEPVWDEVGDVDLAAAAVGQLLTYTFTVRNDGYADLVLEPQSLSVPGGYSVVNELPSVVAPGESRALTLELDTSAPGEYEGTVSFVNSDADEGPYSFHVAATVYAPEPVGIDDSYTVVYDTLLEIPVEDGTLSNDWDPAGLALTAQLATSPQHGNVELRPDGSFTYQPNTFYSGPDSFEYTASNGTEDSPSTTVVLHVKGPNELDLTIYDGQLGRAITEEVEYEPQTGPGKDPDDAGAYTVANLNDTDGDSRTDSTDPVVQAVPIASGRKVMSGAVTGSTELVLENIDGLSVGDAVVVGGTVTTTGPFTGTITLPMNDLRTITGIDVATKTVTVHAAIAHTFDAGSAKVGHRGRDEVDLMRLDVRKPADVTEGNVTLTIVSGNVALWKQSYKGSGNQVTITNGHVEIPVADFVGGKVTYWIEALSASTVLRDIELRVDYPGKEGDAVRATAIWATVSLVEHDLKTVDQLPSDIDARHRAEWNRYWSGTGLMPPKPKGGPGEGFHNGILVQYTVGPVDIYKVDRVSFDATRRMYGGLWYRRSADQVWRNDVRAGKQWDVRHFELPNDDALYGPKPGGYNPQESGSVNSNGHYYMFDAPGVPYLGPADVRAPNRGDYQYLLFEGNAVHWLRISFDPRKPAGAGNVIAGSQVSDRAYWQVRHSLETAEGKWRRVLADGQAPEARDAEETELNLIRPNHLFFTDPNFDDNVAPQGGPLQ